MLSQVYGYTPLWYSGLVQVRYYCALERKYKAGIAFEDKVVDAATGDTFKIDDLIDAAAFAGIYWDDTIIERSWNNLSEAIMSRSR